MPLDDAIRLWRVRPLLRTDAVTALVYNAEENWADPAHPPETAPSLSFVVPDAHFHFLTRTDYAGAALAGGIVVQQGHIVRKYVQPVPGSRKVRVRGADAYITEFGRDDELRKVFWYVPIDADRGRVYGTLDGTRRRTEAELLDFVERLEPVT